MRQRRLAGRSFNGAAFLRTRKPNVQTELGTYGALLQWGRVPANAEGGAAPGMTRFDLSFNGAALLRARKGAN